MNDMAAHYGIDLDAAIEAKMEHNRGRSYRHGGRHCEQRSLSNKRR